MKKEEKLLFKSLCKFKDEQIDESQLQFATPTVLGLLFFNRMQAIAYNKLKQSNMLNRINREFRTSLKTAFEHNIIKNHSYAQCIKMVSDALSSADGKVAMLKGAYLYSHYPEGYRTANDIDLLVMPDDVTEIGNLLSRAGFKQGHIRNGQFTEATRREIIESRMMRGETIPYIKEVGLPFMKYAEVDINFSLDYKPGETYILSDMLSHITRRSDKGNSINTLSDADFFIHLCAHLYKEATTLPWVEMKRDMTLYKYCDIYLLLNEMSEEEAKRVFTRVKELEMEKICAYAILETIDLFDMDIDAIRMTAENVLIDDPAFRLTVVSPKDKKTYRYRTQCATDRFFMSDRTVDLEVMFVNENS